MRGAARDPSRAVAAALASLLLLAAGCGGGEDARAPAAAGRDGSFDGVRAFADLRAQVRIGPRASGSPGSERVVAFITRRLHAVGAERARVQRPLRNVVATVGGGPPTIVIGAHHDTKDGIPGFLGANDGASGVAVVLELARVVGGLVERGELTGSYAFVLFDGEEARGDRPFDEDGTRGSRQFVELAEAGGGQGTPSNGDIEAMLLLDMVGDCDLEVPREANSDADLYGLLEGEAFEGETGGVLDDHVPFVEAGIPALDVIDFDYGPGPSPGAWWHTTEDTLDKVCPESLDQVGEAVIGALMELRG